MSSTPNPRQLEVRPYVVGFLPLLPLLLHPLLFLLFSPASFHLCFLPPFFLLSSHQLHSSTDVFALVYAGMCVCVVAVLLLPFHTFSSGCVLGVCLLERLWFVLTAFRE